MAQPINLRQELGTAFSKQNVITFAKRFAADTATTTLATAVCTSFNPAAGLIIGAVSYPTTKLINWICKKLHVGENSIIAKTSARALSIITGIALGALLAKAAGLQITFIGACVITLATWGLYILAGILGIGSIALSVLAAQALLKALPRPQENQTENRARTAIENFRNTANDILHNRIGIDRHIEKAHSNLHQLVNECRRILRLEEQPIDPPPPPQVPENPIDANDL